MKHFVDSDAYFPVTNLKRWIFFSGPQMGCRFKELAQHACAWKWIHKTFIQLRQHLRRGVQADTVCLRGWCRLVTGGEDGKTGGGVDHVIDQVTNRRRAKSRALLYKQRVPIKHTKIAMEGQESTSSPHAAIWYMHAEGWQLKIMGKHEYFI